MLLVHSTERRRRTSCPALSRCKRVEGKRGRGEAPGETQSPYCTRPPRLSTEAETLRPLPAPARRSPAPSGAQATGQATAARASPRGLETQPASRRTLHEGIEGGQRRQRRPRSHRGGARGLGAGAPHPSPPGAPGKLPTWRSAPLRQLLRSDCRGRETGEGAWSSGGSAEATPLPRPQGLPANGAAAGARGGGGGAAGAGRAEAVPVALCVRAAGGSARRAPGDAGLGCTAARKTPRKSGGTRGPPPQNPDGPAAPPFERKEREKGMKRGPRETNKHRTEGRKRGEGERPLRTQQGESHLQARKRVFHRNRSGRHLWSWTSQLPKRGEINFCRVSHPVNARLSFSTN
ncbi:synapsin-1-like [Equus przewalskii]|uniref:Synapsin-1-like n=1 Tax=Equus przewalskii TaxID=9798 RepID=A0ABM4KA19_EQUPR